MIPFMSIECPMAQHGAPEDAKLQRFYAGHEMPI